MHGEEKSDIRNKSEKEIRFVFWFSILFDCPLQYENRKKHSCAHKKIKNEILTQIQFFCFPI